MVPLDGQRESATTDRPLLLALLAALLILILAFGVAGLVRRAVDLDADGGAKAEDLDRVRADRRRAVEAQTDDGLHGSARSPYCLTHRRTLVDGGGDHVEHRGLATELVVRADALELRLGQLGMDGTARAAHDDADDAGLASQLGLEQRRTI